MSSLSDLIRPEHVDVRLGSAPFTHANMQRYHEWMKSPELLESTASEPLTIEEERDMQSTLAGSGPVCYPCPNYGR